MQQTQEKDILKTEYKITKLTKKFSFVASLINSVENNRTLTHEEKNYSKSQISSELCEKNQQNNFNNLEEYRFNANIYQFKKPKEEKKRFRNVKRGFSSSFINKNNQSLLNPKSVSARGDQVNSFKTHQHQHSHSINLPENFHNRVNNKNANNFSSKNLTDLSINGISSINIKDFHHMGNEELGRTGNAHQDKYLLYKRTRSRSRRQKSSDKKNYELFYKKNSSRFFEKKLKSNYNFEILSHGNQSISRISEKLNNSKYSYSIREDLKRVVNINLN